MLLQEKLIFQKELMFLHEKWIYKYYKAGLMMKSDLLARVMAV